MNRFERPDIYHADCMEALKEFPDQFFARVLRPPSIILDSEQIGELTEEMIRNIDWRRTICGN